VFELERLAAEMYLLSGLWKEGVAILRPLAEHAGLPFPGSHSTALAGVVWERAKLAARRFQLHEHTQPSPDLLRKIDVCISLSKCMAVFEPLVAGYFMFKALSFSLDAGEPRRLCHTLGIYLSAEAGFEQKTRAEQERDWKLTRDLARRSGDPTLSVTTDVLEGIALFNLGRWKEAADLMQKADRELRHLPRGLPWDIGGRLSFIRMASFFTGDLERFLELVSEHQQDTKQRGDLLESTSVLLHSFWRFLRDDDPKTASETVGHAIRQYPMPTIGESHEWPGVHLLAQLDLYCGDFVGLSARLERAWPAFKRSGILRANVWGTLFLVFRAYASLLSGKSGRPSADAKALVKRLHRSKHEWQSGFGHALDACIALVDRKTGRARDSLDLAQEAFERHGLTLYAASARRQRGVLVGGRAGDLDVAAAEELMRAQGIVSPRRWSAMYVPLPL
jgi:hypothetical protein